MKAIKLALIASAALVLLPACSQTGDGVTKAELDQVRDIAEKARACCASNTARIDRMFEKAMAK